MNFGWIDDVPEGEWQQHDDRKTLKLILPDFLKRSGLPRDANWRPLFNAWADEHPKGYRATGIDVNLGGGDPHVYINDYCS
ncbi:hypothetical protein [Stenotrophomonas sp. PS02301]|uniref:hypothetical protein n=1 Tax=Stenotrophomonas sp. PS02301 TaxID=2991427 RepID=UPI00249B1769|nr:hypothetical protein [Stenotrophomonas sp. PS02301]